MKRPIQSVLLAIAIACTSSNAKAHAQPYSADKAMQYFQTKNWNELLPYLNNWTKAVPNDPMPWYYLGTSYGSKTQGIGMGRPTDARVAFQKLSHSNRISPKHGTRWAGPRLSWTTSLPPRKRSSKPPNTTHRIIDTATVSAQHSQR